MNVVLILLAPIVSMAPTMLLRIIGLIGEVTPAVFEPAPSVGPLVFGFSLLLILFLLINLDRRFREYVSRALVRPFNFFADVRDQRLIPGVQTTILAIILSGALGLCFTAVVRLCFEVPAARQTFELLLPSGFRATLFRMTGDYMSMLVRLTVLSFAGILSVTALLRFATIFVRGRILLGDTYNVAVWSLLPMAFLLPIDLILPRMDVDGTTVVLSLAILFVLFLWYFYRLLKGTGVLFDVYPTRLYIYGTLVLSAVLVLLFFYLQRNYVFENFSLAHSVIRRSECASRSSCHRFPYSPLPPSPNIVACIFPN